MANDIVILFDLAYDDHQHDAALSLCKLLRTRPFKWDGCLVSTRLDLRDDTFGEYLYEIRTDSEDRLEMELQYILTKWNEGMYAGEPILLQPDDWLNDPIVQEWAVRYMWSDLRMDSLNIYEAVAPSDGPHIDATIAEAENARDLCGLWRDINDRYGKEAK